MSYDYHLATMHTDKLICKNLHLGLKKTIFGYVIVCSFEQIL